MNKTAKNILIGTASSALVALFAWLFHRTEKPTPVASEPAPAPVTQPVGVAKEPQPKPTPVAKPAAAPQPKPAQTEKDLFKDRRVIIDGTNVCFWRKRERGCLSLGDLLAICMDLHRRGVDYKVFFDATTRYRLRDSGEAGDKELYLKLLEAHPDRFCEVNRGESADLAVLEAAAVTPAGQKPALILTRDNYFEHRARFPFAGDTSRRLWGEIGPKGFYFRRFDWLVKLEKAA